MTSVAGERWRHAALTALANAWFAAMFFVCLPAGVLWLANSPWTPPPGGHRWLGAALIVASQALLLLPLRDFVVAGRGTQAPLLPPRRLVTRGLHAHLRNPMYALYLVTVVGEAVLYRSAALGVYALAFFGLMHAYVVGIEEPHMRRRFGADFEAYCRRVGRWLPRRRR